MRRSQALPLSFLSLPVALAGPAARWGHQAVYVKSKQAMYIVGGQVTTGNNQITNDVLVLSLNDTNPSFTSGPNDALPPHAFASMDLSKDEQSLVVVGGMTSNCGSDTITHTLDLAGGTTWSGSSPASLVRRRNGGVSLVDVSSNGGMLVVGGISDVYSCASSTYTFPAADVLSLPLGNSSLISTRSLPTTLTGSDLAVSDFAMATGTDGSVYLVGGQDSAGSLVPMETIGKWDKSNGWTSQATSGDIPTGRVGASLTAHPLLDMLVLHGGHDSSQTPSSLLAFLNTTTWAWTVPSNLQPPVSSAASYHSAVMTPSGVMITAFGLSASGPRSDMYYLDMRDPTQGAWTWKNVWAPEMLNSYAASTTTTSGTTPAPASDPKKITSIVVPIIIGLLLLVPLAVFFIRRKIRIERKRRLARHFSFSTQEDSGDFTRPFTPSRKSRTQYPFGQDANEREGSWMSDVSSGVAGVIKRFSRSPAATADPKPRRLNEKTMQWEEIDFGLGGVDEKRNDSRNSSFSAGSPGAHDLDPFGDHAALPLIVTIDESSPRVGTPLHDGQARLLPAVSIIPPTAPATPMPPTSGDLGSYPVLAPALTVDPSPGLDWNILAEELEQKPAFRSISPTSTLRSHAHGPESPVGGRRASASSPSSRQVEPLSPSGTFGSTTSSPISPISPIRPVGPAPNLPPFEFMAPGATITLVNPKTGRRTSAEATRFPVPQPHMQYTSGVSPRSVSTPTMPGRQLAGRRESAPSIEVTPPEGKSSLDYVRGSEKRRGSSGSIGSGTYSSASLQGRRGSALRIVNPTEE